jgi:hypothetical protein
LIVKEETDRGFDPLSTPRWRLNKMKSVYPHSYGVNALGVSSGADGCIVYRVRRRGGARSS